MALTPATLPRHELVGLWVRVAAAANRDLEGIDGRVVRETERTLVVESNDGRERRVPKRHATFEFALADRDASGRDDATAHDEGVDGRGGHEHEIERERGPTTAVVPPADPIYVTVAGERLVATPARRTETTGESKWR